MTGNDVGHMAYWPGPGQDLVTGAFATIWRCGRIEAHHTGSATVRLSWFVDANCPMGDDGKLYDIPDDRWTLRP